MWREGLAPGRVAAMTTRRKAYLIGLDGFNWGLYRYLEERGVIPVLSGLVGKGCGGILRSTRPPYTGPAWVSMFTGRNPGAHGIYGFTRRRRESYAQEVLNASSIRVPRLWDYLGEAGKSVGVFNVPFTFPAAAVSGFMVTGMLTPSADSPCAFPPAVAGLVKAAEPYPFDLGVDPDLDAGSPSVIGRIELELAAKVSLLDRLLEGEDPDFLMTVFVAPDRLQHLWGKAILTGDECLSPRIRDGILSVFSRLDRALGALADRLGDEGLLLIASDHGFTGLEGTFYLNSWLVREGFLVLRSGAGGFSRFLGRCNRPWLKRMVPRRLLRYSRSGSLSDLIDWGSTRAYASPGMEEGLYYNRVGREPAGVVDAAEAGELDARLAASLADSGMEGIAGAVVRDEVYRGDCVGMAPDLLLDFRRPGWNMSPSLTGDVLSRRYQGSPFGIHHPDGFWSASGPGIEPGAGGEGKIVDVAPSVLSFLGVAVPDWMEGSPLPSLSFAAPPSPAGREFSPRPGPEKHDYGPDEEAAIKHRLAGLGYL